MKLDNTCYTVRSDLLRGKMAEHGYTIAAMAKKLSVDPVTLSNKLETGRFWLAEVYVFIWALGLDGADVGRIFFAEKDT